MREDDLTELLWFGILPACVSLCLPPRQEPEYHRQEIVVSFLALDRGRDTPAPLRAGEPVEGPRGRAESQLGDVMNGVRASVWHFRSKNPMC